MKSAARTTSNLQNNRGVVAGAGARERSAPVGLCALLGCCGRTSSRWRAARAAALACCVAGVTGQAFAGPRGAQVVTGDVAIQQQGLRTTITASDGAIIRYQSFDIASNEAVRFVQPGAAARVLNRIESGMPTAIDGRLDANGIVYLVNPAGVMFGPNSVVDVAGLVASSADITDIDFANGIDRFVGSGGAVTNYGTIQASNVTLLGRHVRNFGEIRADGGIVTMAAGDSFLIGEVGGDIMVRVDGRTLAGPGSGSQQGVGGVTPASLGGEAGVLNEGLVQADLGRPLLVSGDLYALGVHNVGRIIARGGDTTIAAADGAAVNAGRIDVSAPNAARLTQGGAWGGTAEVRAPVVVQSGEIRADGGGSVTLAGRERTLVLEGSRTTAGGGAHLTEGGSITIGGGGRTAVERGAVVQAPGGFGADGGSVLIGGDELGFAGSVSVAGGAGGRSGTLTLENPSLVVGEGFSTIARASDGATLALDPDAVLSATGPAMVSGASLEGLGGALTLRGAESLRVSETLRVSGRTPVRLESAGDVSLDAPVVGSGGLSVVAGGDVTSAGLSDTPLVLDGPLEVRAGGDVTLTMPQLIIAGASIQTAGDISLPNPAADIDAGGDDLVLRAGGDVDLGANAGVGVLIENIDNLWIEADADTAGTNFVSTPGDIVTPGVDVVFTPDPALLTTDDGAGGVRLFNNLTFGTGPGGAITGAVVIAGATRDFGAEGDASVRIDQTAGFGGSPLQFAGPVRLTAKGDLAPIQLRTSGGRTLGSTGGQLVIDGDLLKPTEGRLTLTGVATPSDPAILVTGDVSSLPGLVANGGVVFQGSAEVQGRVITQSVVQGNADLTLSGGVGTPGALPADPPANQPTEITSSGGALTLGGQIFTSGNVTGATGVTINGPAAIGGNLIASANAVTLNGANTTTIGGFVQATGTSGSITSAHTLTVGPTPPAADTVSIDPGDILSNGQVELNGTTIAQGEVRSTAGAIVTGGPLTVERSVTGATGVTLNNGATIGGNLTASTGTLLLDDPGGIDPTTTVTGLVRAQGAGGVGGQLTSNHTLIADAGVQGAIGVTLNEAADIGGLLSADSGVVDLNGNFTTTADGGVSASGVGGQINSEHVLGTVADPVLSVLATGSVALVRGGVIQGNVQSVGSVVATGASGPLTINQGSILAATRVTLGDSATIRQGLNPAAGNVSAGTFIEFTGAGNESIVEGVIQAGGNNGAGVSVTSTHALDVGGQSILDPIDGVTPRFVSIIGPDDIVLNAGTIADLGGGTPGGIQGDILAGANLTMGDAGADAFILDGAGAATGDNQFLRAGGTLTTNGSINKTNGINLELLTTSGGQLTISGPVSTTGAADNLIIRAPAVINGDLAARAGLSIDGSPEIGASSIRAGANVTLGSVAGTDTVTFDGATQLVEAGATGADFATNASSQLLLRATAQKTTAGDLDLRSPAGGEIEARNLVTHLAAGDVFLRGPADIQNNLNAANGAITVEGDAAFNLAGSQSVTAASAAAGASDVVFQGTITKSTDGNLTLSAGNGSLVRVSGDTTLSGPADNLSITSPSVFGGDVATPQMLSFGDDPTANETTTFTRDDGTEQFIISGNGPIVFNGDVFKSGGDIRFGATGVTLFGNLSGATPAETSNVTFDGLVQLPDVAGRDDNRSVGVSGGNLTLTGGLDFLAADAMTDRLTLDAALVLLDTLGLLNLNGVMPQLAITGTLQSTMGGTTLTVTDASLLDVDGDLISAGPIDLTNIPEVRLGGDVTAATGIMLGQNATDQVFLDGTGLQTINAGAGTLMVAGDLVKTGGALSLASVSNIGRDLSVTGATLTTNSGLTVGRDLLVTGGGLVANANLMVTRDLTTTGGGVTLNGGANTTMVGDDLTSGGNFTTAQALTVTDQLMSSGSASFTGGAMSSVGGSVTAQGAVTSTQALTVGGSVLAQAGLIDLNGSPSVGGDLIATDSVAIGDPGGVDMLMLTGAGDQRIQGGGAVLIDGPLTKNSGNLFVRSGGGQRARVVGDVSVPAGNATFESASRFGGDLIASGAVTLGDAAGEDALFDGSGVQRIDGSSITGADAVRKTGGSLSVEAPTTLAGELRVTGGNLAISGPGVTQAGAVISSGALTSTQVIRSGGVIQAGGAIDLQGAGLTTAPGNLISTGSTITSRHNLNIGGDIDAQGNLQILTPGTAVAGGSIVSRTGSIVSDKALTATAGDISAATVLTLNADATAGQDVRATGGALTAAGNVSAGRDITGGTTVSLLTADAAQDVRSGGALTATGLLTAGRDISGGTSVSLASATAGRDARALGGSLGATGAVTAGRDIGATGGVNIAGAADAGGLVEALGGTLVVSGPLTTGGNATGATGVTLGGASTIGGDLVATNGPIALNGGGQTTSVAGSVLAQGATGALDADHRLIVNTGDVLVRGLIDMGSGVVVQQGRLASTDASVMLNGNSTVAQSIDAAQDVTLTGVGGTSGTSAGGALRAGGSISAAHPVTVGGELNAGDAITLASTLNAGGNVSSVNATSVTGAATVAGDVSGSSVAFGSTLNLDGGAGQTLTGTSGGVDVAGALTKSGGNLALAGAGGNSVGGNVSVSGGGLSASTPVTFGSGVGSVATSAGQSYAGDLTTRGATSFDAGGAFETLGTTLGEQSPGGARTAIVIDAPSTTIGGPLTAQSLTITGGPIALTGGTITTTGAQSYGGAVSVLADQTLVSQNAGNIAFAGDVNGGSGAGGGLTVNTAGVTSFGGGIMLPFLVTDAGGSTSLASDVITSGRQVFGDLITLGPAPSALAPRNFTSTGNQEVSLLGGVDGAGWLVQANTSGATRFGGATTAGRIVTDAPGAVGLSGVLTTTNGLALNASAIGLEGNTAIVEQSGQTLVFNAPIEGPGGLTATSAGSIVMRGNVGVNAPVAFLGLNTPRGDEFMVTQSSLPGADIPALDGDGLPLVAVSNIIRLELSRIVSSGDVVFNSTARTMTPEIATIYALPPTLSGIGSYTLDIDAGGAFSLAQGEKLTVLGDLNVTSASASLTDIVTLGDMTITSPAISLVDRVPGLLRAPSLAPSTAADSGVDFITGGVFAFSSAPAGQARFGSLNAAGDVNGTLRGQFNQNFGSAVTESILLPEMLFVTPGGPLRTDAAAEAFYADPARLPVLDLPSDGPTVADVSTSFAGALPDFVAIQEVESEVALTLTELELLRRLAIDARRPAPEEFRDSAERGVSLFDDAASRLESPPPVTADRLFNDRVRSVLREFENLPEFGSPDTTVGSVQGAERAITSLRLRLDERWREYADETPEGDWSAAGFREYLEANEEGDALVFIGRLRDTVRRIRTLGVTDREFAISRDRIIRGARPDGMDEEVFAGLFAIEGEEGALAPFPGETPPASWPVIEPEAEGLGAPPQPMRERPHEVPEAEGMGAPPPTEME